MHGSFALTASISSSKCTPVASSAGVSAPHAHGPGDRRVTPSDRRAPPSRSHLRAWPARAPLDAGSQFASLAFTAELHAAGIAGSIGTVGDALDNALCEFTTGLFKTEAIHDGTTWNNRSDVEWQVARWVHWYNSTPSPTTASGGRSHIHHRRVRGATSGCCR
jgi:transposase InsO family protein